MPQGTDGHLRGRPARLRPHWNVAGVAPGAFTDKFYDADDRPELEALVHNLEHGYTILWYDETIADDAGQVSEIKAIAKKFDLDDTNFRLKFIAAPWTSERRGRRRRSPTASTSRSPTGRATTQSSTGVWQYCSRRPAARPSRPS